MVESADEQERLETAIASLEAQRELLGDGVVDTALGPLREQLDALRSPRRSPRRQVTVVFADLCGYTTLSEGADPEDVMAMLNDLWGEVDQQFEALRGTVMAHMGDGLMAVWGADEATEEDAERAVQASLRAIEHVERHGIVVDGIRREATLSVGVHTGQVHVGVVGTQNEFSAIGDTTNVAARLEGIASPGRVVISRDTYHQVRGVFDVSEAGSLELKGRRVPVTAYVIDRERERAFRTNRRGIDGVDTELAGRSRELATLQRAHGRCVDGVGFELVTLVGEPGIGKSRLLAEFRDWLEIHTTTHIRYFEASAVRERRDQPYSLLRDLLAHRFELVDSDSVDEVLGKLEAGLAELGDAALAAGAQTLGWVLGFTASDETGRGDSQLRSNAARSLLVDTLLGLLAPMPALVVIEDLHWADSASLAVLADVVASGPPSSMIFASTRPDLRATEPQWCSPGGLDPRHRVIELGALDTDALDSLVDAVLVRCDEVPATLRSRLIEESNGNPFHLEELVRMMIDAGVITTGARWSVDLDRLDHAEVPSTIAGVLQSRLDHLPLDQYEALQHASVIGRTFWDTAVAALLERPVDEVRRSLAGAADADFIGRDKVSQLDGALEFAFHHDLNRTVTYETVSLGDRPLLHRRAADWLISSTGARSGEFAVTIARHFDVAGDLDEAAGWFATGAAAAKSQSAYSDAAGLWAQAADRTTGRSAEEFTLAAANARIVAGEFPAAAAALEQLHAASEHGVVRAEAAAGLAGIAMFRDGAFDRAAELLSDALDELLATPAGPSDDDDEQALARLRVELLLRHQQGNLHIAVGNWQQAVEILSDCAERAGEQLPSRRAVTLNSLAHVYAQQGRTDDTHRIAEEVAAQAEELGDPRVLMGAMAQRGLVALRTGRWIDARRWLGEAQALNRRNGDPEKVATVANYLGEVALGLSDFDEARRHFDEAIAVGQRAGAVTEMVRAVAGHGAIRAEFGDLTWAAQALAGVLKHPAAGGEASRAVATTAGRYGLDLAAVDELIEVDAAIASLSGERTGDPA